MDKFVTLLKSSLGYFNDFIGAVAPGIVLVVGMLFAFQVDVGELPTSLKSLLTTYGTFAAIAVTIGFFALGHVVAVVSLPLRNLAEKAWFGDKWSKVRNLSDNDAFAILRVEIANKLDDFDPEDLSPSTVRSMAMSMSSDAEELGRRFKFLALFCYGSGTAVLAIGLVKFVAIVAVGSFTTTLVIALVVGLIVGVALVIRAAQLDNQSRTVPFPTALAEIIAVRLKIKGAGASKVKTKPATTPDGSIVAVPEAPDVFPI